MEQDDAQEVLTEIREHGSAPPHTLRARLGWEGRRFTPVVNGLVQEQKLVRLGGMLSLPTVAFTPPTSPPDWEERGDSDQEPVTGPDVPLEPEEPSPPAPRGMRRFLVATEWREYEHAGDADSLADQVLNDGVAVDNVLVVADSEARVYERAVVARRVP